MNKYKILESIIRKIVKEEIKNSKKIVNYDGMDFIFHPKMNENGFYFTHEASGHGLFNSINAESFGKPSMNNATVVLKDYIESSSERRKILKQYKEKYSR